MQIDAGVQSDVGWVLTGISESVFFFIHLFVRLLLVNNGAQQFCNFKSVCLDFLRAVKAAI